jgi:hypothetical protein
MAKVLGWLGSLFFVAGFLGGLGVLGWQVFMWLKSSAWTDLSVVHGLQWLEVSWAMNPTDWLGVHEVLNDFPLAIALPLLGWALGWAAISVAKDIAKRARASR